MSILSTNVMSEWIKCCKTQILAQVSVGCTPRSTMLATLSISEEKHWTKGSDFMAWEGWYRHFHGKILKSHTLTNCEKLVCFSFCFFYFSLSLAFYGHFAPWSGRSKSVRSNKSYIVWHTYIHTNILYLNSSLSRALPPSILTTNYMNISWYA